MTTWGKRSTARGGFVTIKSREGSRRVSIAPAFDPEATSMRPLVGWQAALVAGEAVEAERVSGVLEFRRGKRSTTRGGFVTIRSREGSRRVSIAPAFDPEATAMRPASGRREAVAA
jgi:hypothetical protein